MCTVACPMLAGKKEKSWHAMDIAVFQKTKFATVGFRRGILNMGLFCATKSHVGWHFGCFWLGNDLVLLSARIDKGRATDRCCCSHWWWSMSFLPEAPMQVQVLGIPEAVKPRT